MTEWRQQIADEVLRASAAHFVAIYTCPAGDPSRSAGAVAGAATQSLVESIHFRFLAFSDRERGRSGMDVAHEFGSAAHAPLLDTAYRKLAAALRRDLLDPQGIRGILVAHLVTDEGLHVGWIAVGSPLSEPEALALFGAELSHVARAASDTLSSAFEVARACGFRTPAELPLALSARERQIAVMVTEGLSDANVAARLSLSEETVGAHLRRIFRKLGVHSRVELSARLQSD